MIVDCQYQMIKGALPTLDGCAANFNEEQQEAISRAFSRINVSIEIDETWGFCRIVAINGVPVKDNE